MASGKELGLFLVSIVLSVVITSGLTLFVLPEVSQQLGAPLSQGTTGTGIQGILVQSKYQTWQSHAVLADSSTTSYNRVPGTNLSITIQESSRIAAVFSSYYCLSNEDLTNNDELRYHISLVIEGVGNETTSIYYTASSPPAIIERVSSTLYIDYVTDDIPAGTYTVSVWWVSEFNQFDVNQLRLSYGMENRTRSLLVQEWL